MLTALFDLSPDAIVVVNREGRMVRVNRLMEALFGYTQAELMNMSVEMLLPERLQALHLRHRAGYFAEPRLRAMGVGLELLGRRKDGSEFPVDILLGPVETTQGIVVKAVIRDITERKQAEEERGRLPNVLEKSLNEIYTFDIETLRFQYVNYGARQNLGYELVQLQNMTPLDLKPEYTKASFRDMIGPLLRREKETHVFETVHRRADGSVYPVEVHLQLVEHVGGHLFLAVINDITERRQAEAALRKLSSAIEQTADNVFICNKDGVIEYVNPAFEALTGYSKEEAIGQTPRLLKSGLHPTKFFEALWNTILAGKVFRATFTNQKKNGEVYYEEKTISPLRDAQGNITHFVSTGKDITERVRAEAALEEREKRFRALIENASDAIALVGADGAILYESPALTRVLGYAVDERVGRAFLELVHPDDLPDITHRFAQLRQQPGVIVGAQLRYRHKDGSWRWLEGTGQNLLDEPSVQAIVANYRDITERKQREREREAVITVAAALRIAPTRAEMLPVLLDQITELLNVEGAALAMRDPATGESVIELGYEQLARFTGQRLAPGEGVAGLVIATSQPYLNDDVRRDPRFARPGLISRDAYAAACVPLVAQEQTIGALWVARQKAITEYELRMLSAIADMAANAIHRAALHEETARRVQQLLALQTIDHALTASLDLGFSLDILLEQTVAQLRAAAAGVLLYDPRALSLNYAAGRGFRARNYEHSHLRLGEGQAGHAALEQRTLQAADLNACDPPFTRLPLLTGEGFVSYAAAPLISKGQIKGVLEIFYRAPFQPDQEWLNFFEALAQQAAIAIDSAQLFDNLQKSNLELSLAYDATIEGWSHALDLRDKETEGHTLRVTEMTLRLAHAAGMTEEELVHVRRGTLLHDIGKMGVPDAILLKPDKLTDDEWVAMRKHPTFAYELLLPIAFLRPALDIPYCHHEKWDGTGYPRGLKGEQIPRAARIFAVVDVWDALRSDRPYRPAWPEEKVREHIRAGVGTHFDPQVVEVFLKMQSEAEAG